MEKRIGSIELPESEYVLTKVDRIDDKVGNIDLGRTVIGELISNPIRVGERCRVCSSVSWRDDLITSQVRKISIDSTDSNKIILETENSVYTLEELINVKRQI